MSPKKTVSKIVKPKTRRNPLNEAMMEKGFYAIPKAAELLRMDQSSVHRLCDEEKIKHLRVGARTFVTKAAIVEYLGVDVAKLLGVK